MGTVVPFRRETSAPIISRGGLEIRPVPEVDELVVAAIVALRILADEATAQGLEDIALESACCVALLERYGC